MLVAPLAAFLVVAGIGAFTSHLEDASELTAFEERISPWSPSSDSIDEVTARLVTYARSVGIEGPAAPAPLAAADDLPDVNTMTDRLAARLETAPEDIQGWILLLRSRVVLGEQESAATTLRTALEVFKANPAASEEIRATAVELGLKAD
jgi:cytochrome c-type biogenesis protein CcmH